MAQSFDTTIGLAANATSGGQSVDFDAAVASNVTIINNSGISIQYSLDGSQWLTVTNGSTLPLGTVPSPAAFRLRKSTSDSYPVSVRLTWIAYDTAPASKVKVTANRNVIPARLNARQVMTTPPTVTTGAVATITGQQRWFAADNASFAQVSVVNDWCSLIRWPLGGLNVTTGTAPTYGSQCNGFVFIHDGASFELNMTGTSTSYLIKVDDQYVSATPQATGTGAFFAKYAFSSTKRRRIEIVGYNIQLNGVNINATDSIEPAPIRGPRCIVVGDSFTAGSGSSAGTANSFVAALADLLGWDDVWPSGNGGTGYVATNGGAAPAYGSRLAHDVIAYNPEVVWFVGSINDDGQTAATVGAAALAAYQQIATALPNALIIASPNAKNGVNGYSATKLAIKDAMKAAVQSVGGIWVDPLELPLNYAVSGVPNGTIRNSVSAGLAGSTGFNVYGFQPQGGYPQVGATIEIGSGANRERLHIKSGAFAGSDSGTYYFLTKFDGTLQYNHSAGETWRQVGGSYLTGTGKVGAVSGFGNSDLYCGTDGVHPSDAGHAAFAENLATQLLVAIGPN